MFKQAECHRPNGSRWLFDITDFVNFSIWTGTCIGIQRVEFEILRCLRHRSDLVVFSTFDDVLWDMTSYIRSGDLDVDDLIAESRRRHPLHRPSRTDMRNPLLYVRRWWRRRQLPPALRSGDRLLVAGAWWDVETMYNRCLEAQAKGLEIVAILYDLIPLLHTELIGHDYSEHFRRLLTIPMHICSISDYTKAELAIAIAQQHAVQPLSINVTPLAHEFPGVARNDRSIPLPATLADRLSDRPFVLSVGTIEIRKNHARLLDAWHELGLRRGDDLPLLVVAGKRGWKVDETIDRLNSQPGVVFVEGPKDADLRALYANCLFTVFPSSFEGWGLPVGESLWFGKACACSNATTMPEVGGDLCEYFAHDDAADMGEKIERLLDDDTRRAWEERIRDAPLRTWADVGASVSKVVQSLSDKTYADIE